MVMKLWRKPFDSAEIATTPGQVHIDKERCKGCGYCVEFCPRGVLKTGHELNLKGYLLPIVADESRCLACGYCEVVCPEFAIKVSTPDNSGRN
jgi:2-oxoglutarate ferredoxin oxidoreductase subunit delta